MSHLTIINCRNGERWIESCILSIQRSKNKDTILLDDHSTDATCEIAKRLGVEIHTPGKRLGCQQGFRKCLELGHESMADTIRVMCVDDILILPMADQHIDLSKERDQFVCSPSFTLRENPTIFAKMNAVKIVQDQWIRLHPSAIKRCIGRSNNIGVISSWVIPWRLISTIEWKDEAHPREELAAYIYLLGNGEEIIYAMYPSVLVRLREDSITSSRTSSAMNSATTYLSGLYKSMIGDES